MQKTTLLDGAICRVTTNGVLFLVPIPRYPVYFLLAGTGLLSVLLWKNGLKMAALVLMLVCSATLLFLWLKQPQLQISTARGRIVWRKWFRRRLFTFSDVARVEVFFEHQSLDFMGHLAVRTRTILVTARLEIILRDGSRLSLGKISGRRTKDHALHFAETLARILKVPMRSAGSV